jgi:hypothetical protein
MPALFGVLLWLFAKKRKLGIIRSDEQVGCGTPLRCKTYIYSWTTCRIWYRELSKWIWDPGQEISRKYRERACASEREKSSIKYCTVNYWFWRTMSTIENAFELRQLENSFLWSSNLIHPFWNLAVQWKPRSHQKIAPDNLSLTTCPKRAQCRCIASRRQAASLFASRIRWPLWSEVSGWGFITNIRVEIEISMPISHRTRLCIKRFWSIRDLQICWSGTMLSKPLTDPLAIRCHPIILRSRTSDGDQVQRFMRAKCPLAQEGSRCETFHQRKLNGKATIECLVGPKRGDHVGNLRWKWI